jgi:hypothetical protein
MFGQAGYGLVPNQEDDMSKVTITCVITVDGLIEAPVPAPTAG